MQRFAGARVYVTGATGFIGGAIARQLVAEGAIVTAVARRPERAKALSDLGVRVVRGDVTEPATIDLAEQDVVIHAAAWVGMGIPARKRDLFWRTNVGGTANVVDAARRADVPKFVHVSSVAALPRGRARPDRPATEADFDPTVREFSSFYSQSKTEAHRIVAESGLHAALVMPGVVLGPGGPFEPIFRRLANGKLRALPRGDGEKGWVHVDDVAEGTLHATARGQGPYLLVDDNVTAGELLARVAAVAGLAAPSRRVGLRTLAALAGLVEGAYHAVGKTPPVSRELVAGLAEPMSYDASRARRDLEWAPRMWDRLVSDVRALREPTRRERKARARAAKREAAAAKKRARTSRAGARAKS